MTIGSLGPLDRSRWTWAFTDPHPQRRPAVPAEGAPTEVEAAQPARPERAGAPASPLYQAMPDALAFWMRERGGPARPPVVARTATAQRLREGGQPGEVIDLAAATLGLRPTATQAEIDARFRAIVKAQRPDLGLMDATELERVSHARHILSARVRAAASAARAARWERSATEHAGPALDLNL